MNEIEKTKEIIGISRLDNQTRKALYNKFIDAGGKVINHKQRSNFSEFNRKKQSKNRYELVDNAGNPKKRKTSKSIVNIPSQQEIQKKALKKRKAGPLRRFFERYYIRFRLYFMGVTDFEGCYLTPEFFKKFDMEYKTALIYMQMVYIDIFKQNMRTGKRITDQLDNAKPIYFELIEMISELFDRNEANWILEHYTNFSDIPIKCDEIKEPLMSIFSKLYPLLQYKELLFHAYKRAIDHQMRLEKKQAPYYTAQKKKIKNNLHIIFNRLFPKLYWLFCLYEVRIIPLMTREIEEAILISNDNKPGKRRKVATIQKIELPFLENPQEDVMEEENISIPNDIQKGIEMMYKLDLKKLRKRYDQNNIFEYVNWNDKILTTFLLFREFDEEYSFILTTNKIKYNKISTSSGKLDYKTRLSDLYIELRKCIDSLNEYAYTFSTIEKASREKPISNQQYIEYSNRLTALDKEKSNTGRDARMVVKRFLEKLCDELKALINDIQNAQRIIINPQDRIDFETNIEGDKKLNKKTVHQAITITYLFASALLYRLDPEGDLSGGLEFQEGEKTIFNSNTSIKDEATLDDRRQKIGSLSKKSILNELEDFI